MKKITLSFSILFCLFMVFSLLGCTMTVNVDETTETSSTMEEQSVDANSSEEATTVEENTSEITSENTSEGTTETSENVERYE